MKVVRSRIWVVLVSIAAVAGVRPAAATTDHEDCLDCHGDMDEAYVDGERFLASVHRELDCTSCHYDVDVDDLPHADELEKVYCGDCHDDAQTDFDIGSHGTALSARQPYAPDCKTCHGYHDVLSTTNPEAKTYKMNVPYLCGGCHREGAPVAQLYKIGEHNIIDNYSQSIHGEGLFKKGLTVTATCTSCHGSHKILPHTDPRASIAPRNIAETCMSCHSRIEGVHEQVIRGELWEKTPGAIPACTDCHLPHKVRKEELAFTLADRECLKCHTDPAALTAAGTDTLISPGLLVDHDVIEESVHKNIPCVKCHSDIDPRRKRPCETAEQTDCSNCHAKISDEYLASGHAKGRVAGDLEAPTCITCHGDHDVKSHTDETAATYRAAVPQLCGNCHQEDGVASQVESVRQRAALTDYSMSVHGRGLTEKGLLPSAICIDCHGSHMVLGEEDPQSSVNHRNVPATCATCHRGIYKDFIKSIHYADDEKKDGRLPGCSDCHSSHTITSVDQTNFVREVTDQCGSCHSELAETYMQTMHGKAYILGHPDAAKCSDCHGAHSILAVDDPHSTVGMRNIVNTCKNCHEDANTRFTGYLTHATHHDPIKYPILYYTYWSMTGLLVSVFTFFGIHTLLWLPRSFAEMRVRRKRSVAGETRYYIRRFSDAQRVTHLLVILSFLSLAFTGMMLRFSTMPWAEFVANLLGGVQNAGYIHRGAAVVTFGYFVFHLGQLIRMKVKRRVGWRELLVGRQSMMFNRKDISDFWATLKWFFRAGPKPPYGRWTYWEKFDYLAVFWGVAVIGASGLMLWFPEFFTRFLPGWLINVAVIVHSDEALLAVGFIFTVHFFNTHLRPEAFPMDTVVFTGVTPLESYKHERPEAYALLKQTGELRKLLVKKTISRRHDLLVRIFGYTMLGFGLCLIALIIYSVLFGYPAERH